MSRLSKTVFAETTQAIRFKPHACACLDCVSYASYVRVLRPNAVPWYRGQSGVQEFKERREQGSGGGGGLPLIRRDNWVASLYMRHQNNTRFCRTEEEMERRAIVNSAQGIRPGWDQYCSSIAQIKKKSFPPEGRDDNTEELQLWTKVSILLWLFFFFKYVFLSKLWKLTLNNLNAKRFTKLWV